MGYFYVPGTETCLRISSRVRSDTYVWGNDRGYDGSTGWGERTSNGLGSEARAYLYMDSRTNTEFGLLRMYTEMFTYIATDDGSGSAPVQVDNAYIQFGGLTAGRGQSFYDFFTGYNFAIYDASYSDKKTNMLGYTFDVGNGLSASVSVEDPTFRNLGIGDIYPSYYSWTTLGGVRAPDVVGALHLDKDWISAQISGALHNVYTNDPSVGSALGWAVLGGVEIPLPRIGPNTSVALQAAGGQGALAYISTGATAPVPSSRYFGSVVPTSAVDATVDPVTSELNLVTAWSVIGGVTHAFTEQWSTNITTSYLDADVDGSWVSGLGDFKNFDLQANLIYTPVESLDIGVEVDYKYVQRQYGNDLNGLVGTFRIERTF